MWQIVDDYHTGQVVRGFKDCLRTNAVEVQSVTSKTTNIEHEPGLFS